MMSNSIKIQGDTNGAIDKQCKKGGRTNVTGNVSVW